MLQLMPVIVDRIGWGLDFKTISWIRNPLVYQLDLTSLLRLKVSTLNYTKFDEKRVNLIVARKATKLACSILRHMKQTEVQNLKLDRLMDSKSDTSVKIVTLNKQCFWTFESTWITPRTRLELLGFEQNAFNWKLGFHVRGNPRFTRV